MRIKVIRELPIKEKAKASNQCKPEKIPKGILYIEKSELFGTLIQVSILIYNKPQTIGYKVFVVFFFT